MSFERRALEGAYMLVSTTLEKAGFLVAFSERSGGVSEGPYASLNLSYSSGDDPAKVAANRRRLIEALRIPPFALGGQVHGAKLVRVGAKRAGAGFDGSPGVLHGNDGLYTARRGVPLAVATADCVPVVLASPAEGTVAIVHAGWRGLAGGIMGKAAALFDGPNDVRVAIGPAAGPCHYEVGKDVALAVAAGSPAGPVAERRNGKFFLDLSGTVRAALEAVGIRLVEDVGLCTIHEEDRFFSHRRDGRCGRQMGLCMRMGER